MKFLLALCLVCMIGCATWKPSDVTMEVAFGTEMAIDYSQTRVLISQNNELNPLIKPISPYVYFPLTFVLHLVVAHYLHGPFRVAWQSSWVAAEGWAIQDNYPIVGWGSP